MSKISKIVGILNLFIMILQIVVIFFYVHKLPNYIIYLDLACVIVYCIIIGSNFKLWEKLRTFKNNVVSLGIYNNTLMKADEDIRAFRHDFNNIMQAVGGYITLNDFEGLREYYNDLTAELKGVTAITPNTVSNSKMYNMIIEKSKISKELDINFEFISLIDFCILENLHIDIEEIVQRLLDIAIEVSKSSSKKDIIFDCLYDFAKKKYIIIVTTFYDGINEQVISNIQDLVLAKMGDSRMKNIEKNKILEFNIDFRENLLIQELDVNVQDVMRKKNIVHV